jgi:hypothetical protein
MPQDGAGLHEPREAVDWYAQRIDACSDEALRRILAHNRDEEKEHACMILEWLRRHDEGWDALLRRFLFRDGPIAAESGEGAGAVAGRNGDGAGEGSLAIGGRAEGATR